MNRWIILICLATCCIKAMGQDITQAEYYFNNDPGNGNGTQISISSDINISDLAISVDISTLQAGIHKLNLRAKDENGVWSQTHQQQIYVDPLPSSMELSAMEYFIDTDPGNGNGTALSTSQTTDISDLLQSVVLNSLDIGTHNLSLRAKDELGQWSHTSSLPFLVFASPIDEDIIKIESYLGSDPGKGLGVDVPISPSADLQNLNIPISLGPLEQGIYSYGVRSLSQDGIWSMDQKNIFYYNPGFPDNDIVELEYFYGADPGLGNGTIVSLASSDDIEDLVISLSIDGLDNGLYSFNLRSKDINHRWSHTYSTIIQISLANPITDIIDMEYYWDIDPGIGNGVTLTVLPDADVSNKVININTSSLSKGIHRLFIRSKNESGEWSITNQKTIYLSPNNNITDIIELEYFVNQDPGFGQGTPINITSNATIANISQLINISSFGVGMHRVYVRAKNALGQWSLASQYFIYKRPSEATKNIEYIEFFWNSDPGLGEATSIPNFVTSDMIIDLNQNMDINSLQNGVNTLFIRAKDDDNQWAHTNIQPVYIYKNPAKKLVTAEYYWDSDPGKGLGFPIEVDTLLSNENKLFNLDITTLDYGMHKLHLRYLTEDGKWTHDQVNPVYFKDGRLYSISEGEYFIDTDPGHDEGIPFNFNGSTDLEDLPVFVFASGQDAGNHDLYIRTKNANQQWSHTNVYVDILFESALPLDWLTFEVEKENENALLSWSVANSINTSHFDIEKRVDNHFSKIGSTFSSNQPEQVYYSHVDNDTNKGWNYYRIKQVDLDTQESYTDIKRVYFDKVKSILIYPNPTTSALSLQNANDEVYRYEILDNALRSVLSGSINGSENIDVAQLKSGAYQLIISAGREILNFTIIKI